MKKILLLAPPGKKTYIRDYYCSKTPKADYMNAPVDLVILSGILNKKFSLFLIDAIVDNINEKQCLRQIKNINPEFIISLVGSVSWEEDILFLKKVKTELGCKLILNGDLLLSKAKEKMLEHKEIDCVLKDFSDNSVIDYILGKRDNLTGLVYREKNKVIEKELKKERYFSAGMPRHDLFIKKKYKLPFVRRFPFATVLTDYGCPNQCSFCIMNQLGSYKARPIDEIIKELEYLKELGVKTIFFIDQTFGLNKQRTIELCNKLIEYFDFEWFCFSRVDVVDIELLRLMKKAGCILIMYGVEFGNDDTLAEYNKGYNTNQIRSAFKLTKKVGIETLGTFLMGMPSENKQKCMDTINFAIELDPDFASFNFAVPRFNTKLREEAIKKGLIKENFEHMDQAGSFISMPTLSLSKKEVKELRRKAILSFYFRPSYIIKRIFKIKTYNQLKEYVLNFMFLLRGVLRWM